MSLSQKEAALRSLDSAALLMPGGTQADGEGTAFSTSGSEIRRKTGLLRYSKSGQFITETDKAAD
ncbi:MAG: hypothetical protein M0Z81_02700 [Deltaproteobacteria bacterium]|jgi:hypothetical protein|nr:hypothetical protein [Deltaproteobacteria bacterium]